MQKTTTETTITVQHLIIRHADCGCYPNIIQFRMSAHKSVYFNR